MTWHRSSRPTDKVDPPGTDGRRFMHDPIADRGAPDLCLDRRDGSVSSTLLPLKAPEEYGDEYPTHVLARFSAKHIVDIVPPRANWHRK